MIGALLLLFGCLAIASRTLRISALQVTPKRGDQDRLAAVTRGGTSRHSDDVSTKSDRRAHRLIPAWILFGLLLWLLSLGTSVWFLASWHAATPTLVAAMWSVLGALLGAMSLQLGSLHRADTDSARPDEPSGTEPSHGSSRKATRRSVLAWVGLAAALALGLWLRSPATDVSLAGRDQGSYALIARSIELRGSWTMEDRIVATAHRRHAKGATSADLLGMYQGPVEAWRSGRYESAYRPGAYLASVERGEIVPQFLPLYPCLLASGRFMLGDSGPPLLLAMLTALTLLSTATIMCAWTGHRSWGIAGALALALTPLMVWLQRTTLSETLTLACVLVSGAILSETYPTRRQLAAVASLLVAAMAVRLSFWLLTPVALWCLEALPVALPTADRAHPDADRPRSATEPHALRRVLACAVALGLVIAACGQVSFPYVHDELVRFFGSRAPTDPMQVAVLGSLAAIALLTAPLVGTTLARLRVTPVAWLRSLALLQLAIVAFAIGYWLSSRTPNPPWSRLEGWIALPPLCVALACVGGLRAWRAITQDSAHMATSVTPVADTAHSARPLDTQGKPAHGGPPPDIGTLVAANAYLALLMLPCLSVLLFANRVLPSFGLWYHGRYVASEIYPALLLLGGFGAAWLEVVLDVVPQRPPGHLSPSESQVLHDSKESRSSVRRFAQTAFVVACGAGVVAPNATLLEMEGAQPAIALLADRVDQGAVVIAGGEGWHHHHAYNQLGGALAFGTDTVVIPYRNKESAYAALWSLLIEGFADAPADLDATHGSIAPLPLQHSVFLLLNEASHDLEDLRTEGYRLSGIDDELHAPFYAKRIDLVDLTVHRLTPTRDYWRRRVTRDGLAFALIEVGVDRDLLARIERLVPPSSVASSPPRQGASDDVQRITLVPRSTPDAPVDDSSAALCAHEGERLRLQVPGEPDRTPLTAALVLAGESLAKDHRLAIEFEIDGTWHEVTTSVGGTPRPRDTLGPWLLKGRPTAVQIKSLDGVIRGGACEGIGIRELRLSPLVAGALAADQVSLHRFEPPARFDSPVAMRSWTAARALTRHRPGPGPRPATEGESMRIVAGRRYRFDALRSPGRQPEGDRWTETPASKRCDLVVNLSETRDLDSPALHVVVNGAQEIVIELPKDRSATWTSPPVEFDCSSPLLELALELVDAAPASQSVPDSEGIGGSALIRDVAIFARGRIPAQTTAATRNHARSAAPRGSSDADALSTTGL